MIEIIKVKNVKALENFLLEVEFSNGDYGVADFSWVKDSTGPMAEPLKQSSFFSQVFLSMGVPTWPNGFDVDAISLHAEMKQEDRLNQTAA